jgi:hypothetical protein
VGAYIDGFINFKFQVSDGIIQNNGYSCFSVTDIHSLQLVGIYPTFVTKGTYGPGSGIHLEYRNRKHTRRLYQADRMVFLVAAGGKAGWVGRDLEYGVGNVTVPLVPGSGTDNVESVGNLEKCSVINHFGACVLTFTKVSALAVIGKLWGLILT